MAGRRAVAAMVAASLPGVGQAAGGQFAVDDAAMLDTGRCQLELWGDSEHRAPTRITHVGPSCRVGPVELGLNVDRLPKAEFDSRTLAGAQVKWTVPLTRQLSAGTVAAMARDVSHGRDTVTTLYAPATFAVTDAVAINANVGWDLVRHGPSLPRSGLSIDWAPWKPLILTAERFRFEHAAAARVGAHWDVNDRWAIEGSRNWSLEAGGPRGWTLGMVIAFAAP